ncbi:OmpA family protein [Mucilaginibacter sp. JRF]|uniref:OmpA family protein n=1 Tax=Mucilaginibacter sp. JRF TaxID=2780088 RepID=UPI0018800AEA|nr:OmpA family protein [Mucilaginibacter sp. JRF]MBE9584845.1 OmpA family protein [Mucilaginibacter sp. JRF]
MKKILLLIFFTGLFCSAKAQFGGRNNNVTLGDKAFRNQDYYEAAHYYLKAAEGIKLTGDVAMPYQAADAGDKEKENKDGKSRAYLSYQLAESYRLYENYIEAEGWYKKVLDEGNEKEYPLARLWYGVCQRATQKYDEAIIQLEQFKAAYKGDNANVSIADKEIANCRFAKEQHQYPGLFDITKKTGDWNSGDGSDYTVVKNNGNYWFTSSRPVDGDKKRVNRIYMAGNGVVKPEVVLLKDEGKVKELEYGAPAFDATGQRMYYTRWYKEGTKTVKQIYVAQMQNGEWGIPKKLNNNVNVDGYNAIQPFVTADGKKLYYASDRPGGQGEDDIWVSDLNGDGSPVNAVNLGIVINTSSDDHSPYYDVKTKRLIYSTKGFVGLGGYDFFESFDIDGKWSAPQNMGYPFNSAKDDLYYFPEDGNSNKFYISSDRESDCCMNIFEGYDKRRMIAGTVKDCSSQKPLGGVKISFMDSVSKLVYKDVVTPASAGYSFMLTSQRAYTIKLEKPGYFTKLIPVTASGSGSADSLLNADFCMQAFVLNKPVPIRNILYDFNEATLRPESKVVLNELIALLRENPAIHIELAAHTDSQGTDEYNEKLSLARAQSCVEYIISEGIGSDRIYAKGYGERKPIAPNTLPDGKDNPEGRQLNRRTEFTVVKIDKLY